MKILQVIERFFPRMGGAEFHVLHISRELAKLGHEVTVVTSSSIAMGDFPGISNKGLTLHSSLPDLPPFETNEDGVRIHRFRPMLQFYTLCLTPGLIRYLFKHIHEYDIIHVHQYLHAEPGLVALISRLHHKPFILTVHDTISAYGGIRESFKNVSDVVVGRAVLRSASAIIALTPINKEQCLELGTPEERIRIVPNGISPGEFEHLTSSKELVRELASPEHIVLFVGRLVSSKGPQYLVQAIPLILSEYPSTLFVFIGQDDGYGSELLYLASREGVSEQCIFAGQVSDQRLKEFYATADVFVLPSTCEAFGIVALESIAAGTPVVLADMGGLRYILSDVGGFPVDMNGEVPKQIAASIKTVFSSNTIQHEVEKQRTKVLQKYSWAGIAKQLTVIYEEVLSR